MKKGGEGDKELPPSPSKGNGYGCKITPIDGTPKGSHVEQLSSEFKQLKLQRKIDKLKESKSCEVASSSLSNEETDASSEEAKDKKGKKGDKRSYNNAFFNYDNLPHFNAFPSVPVGNPPPPHFNGMDYTKWRYSMRMHLISLGLSVWNVVHVGVRFPDEDEEPDFEQLQKIHRNAQACTIRLSSLEKDEFDRVNGLEKTKDIWDTLQKAHEGTKPVKKAKRQLIEGQLDRFVILDDEDPQEMYNRLKKLFNKARAYGSKRWDDRRVIDRML
jgi:hypothetical protein